MHKFGFMLKKFLSITSMFVIYNLIQKKNKRVMKIHGAMHADSILHLLAKKKNRIRTGDRCFGESIYT